MFIDSGEDMNVKWHALYELDPQLCEFPRFSIRCELGDVKSKKDYWEDYVSLFYELRYEN